MDRAPQPGSADRSPATDPSFLRQVIPLENIIGARIELESDEIGWLVCLNRHFLSSRDFGVKLFGDFLRDLALDGEQIVQIAIVLLGPDVRVGARVDQLRVQMKHACRSLRTLPSSTCDTRSSSPI